MPKHSHHESRHRHHKRSPSESSSSSHSPSGSPSVSRSHSPSDSHSRSPSGSPSVSRSPSPSPPPKKEAVKKRAKTAYQYFCDEQRPKLQKKNPEWRLPQLSKELGAMWKAMTDRKKAKYVRMTGAVSAKAAGKAV